MYRVKIIPGVCMLSSDKFMNIRIAAGYFKDIFRDIFFDNSIFLLILFVTSRCNSRCLTCFNYKNINNNNECLDLSQIKKISKSKVKFRNLLLSGGEPFLRTDLAQIIEMFVKNNAISSVTIPTNGILTEHVLATLNKILLLGIQVNVSFSLDGLRELHNKLRGVSCFDSCLNSIIEVQKMKVRYKKLNILVNSVICSENYLELYKLAEYLRKNFNIQGHYFEMIRGDVKYSELKKIPASGLAKAYNDLLGIQNEYVEDNKYSWFVKMLIMGQLIYQYKLQYKNYFYSSRWGIDCFAGKRAVVIGHDGGVSSCELRKPFMNLSVKDYDFDKILASEEKRKERLDIQKSFCDCTHVCFITTSQRYHISSIFKYYKFYREYIRRGYLEF